MPEVINTVAVYGSDENSIGELHVGFILNKNGVIIVSKNAPEQY
jgi:hypothetical protein